MESRGDFDSSKSWRSLNTSYFLSIDRDGVTNLSAREESIRVDGKDMPSTDTLDAEESSIKKSSTNEADTITDASKHSVLR